MTETWNPPDPDDPQHISADRCIDLHAGLLGESERREILAHAARCSGCAARIQYYFGEFHRARAQGQGLAGPPGQVELTPAPGAEARFRAPIDRIGPRARSVVLATTLAAATLACLLLWKPWSGEPRPSPRWVALPSISAQLQYRAVDTDSASIWVRQGYLAYEEGDFRTAAGLFQAAEADDDLEWFPTLYLSSSLIALGEHEAARRRLETLPAGQMPRSWDNELRWSLLVAASHLRDDAVADSLLHLLGAESDSVGARARRMTQQSLR